MHVRHRKFTVERDGDEVAATIRRAGITKDTILLMWHQNCVDVQLLRESLKGADHVILPPDGNCWYLDEALDRMPLNVDPLFFLFFPKTPFGWHKSPGLRGLSTNTTFDPRLRIPLQARRTRKTARLETNGGDFK